MTSASYRARSALPLAATCLLFSTPMQAAAPTASPPADELLADIIVTAQKRAQREQDVPISMTVMGGADLDKSSIASVSDALSLVPGVAVNINGQGGETQLTIRGVTAAGSLFAGPSPIGYYMDSVPFGLVRSAIVPDVDSYDLDRIEVLRGPQGTLYGASALIGVVRVLTHEADFNDFDIKARVTGSATEGGGGNRSGNAAINLPLIDGKLAARLVVGDEHDSGWINSPLGNHINGGDIKTARFKVNAQPSDDLNIKLGVNHEKSTYGAPPTGTNDYTASTLDQPIAQTFTAYDLKFEYRMPWATVSSATSYLRFDNNSALDINPGADPTVDNPPLGTLETSRVFSEEINLVSNLQGPWRWSAGAFYRDARDTNYQTLGDFIPAPVSQADTSRSSAVYGEVARRFGDDRFELAVGARYFHDDVGMDQLVLFGQDPGTPLLVANSTFHAVTPRVVLTWFASHDYTMYASYSQGFRSGFPQGELTLLSAPELPSVKPDKLTNYEVGAKGSAFDNRLSFDAAVFYMKWKDIQESLGIPLAGAGPGVYIVAPVNGQSASGVGVDLAVTYQPVQGLQLGINVGWNGLTEDSAVYSQGGLLFATGSRIDTSPAYTAGAKAQYDFPFASSGWTGQLLALGRYTSLQTTTSASLGSGLPATAVESDSITAARVSFAVMAPSHWRAMLFCNNVGNNRNVPLAMPTPYSSVSQQPRTVGVQLDYNYK